MTFTILGPIVVSLAMMMVTPGLAAEADSESAASAAELSALMGTRGTTVIAAADPVEPDRFIAAMICSRRTATRGIRALCHTRSPAR